MKLLIIAPAACMRPDGGVVLVNKAMQFIEGEEPTDLFGNIHGYQPGGRISTKVQIPRSS